MKLELASRLVGKLLNLEVASRLDLQAGYRVSSSDYCSDGGEGVDGRVGIDSGGTCPGDKRFEHTG